MSATEDLDHRRIALQTIRAEHRVIAQVLEVVRRLLHDIDAGHTAPDYELLSIALYYLESFPARFHHPKEDEYLFAAVRRHTHAFDETLGRLEADHVQDVATIRELYRLLVLWQAGAPDALRDLRDAFERYVDMLYGHMREEESVIDDPRVVIPDAEWREISAAFLSYRDPLFGAEPRREFDLLRRRIDVLLPSKMHHAFHGSEPGGEPQ